MPVICRHKPNRSSPRLFKPKDLTRIVCRMRDQGVPEPLIREAINDCFSMIGDDRGREGFRRLQKLFDQVQRLLEFRRLLDDLFGNTNWRLPPGIETAIERIPVVGPFLKKAFGFASVLNKLIQQLKNAIDAIAGRVGDISALGHLADDSAEKAAPILLPPPEKE